MSHSTYDRLSAASEEGNTFLRIWAEAGESPLQRSADGLSQNGFFSPNDFTSKWSKKQYFEKCGNLDLEVIDNQDESWVRDSILAHVRGTGDWIMNDKRDERHHLSQAPHLQTNQLIGLPAGDAIGTTYTSRSSLATGGRRVNAIPISSPWIVTYTQLDYVIHRIARILARDHQATIHMTVIHPKLDIEKSVGSLKHLQEIKARTPWGGSERKVLHEAIGFAERSGEVLFYGRIFPESVVEDFTWTSERKPFPLPLWFRRDLPSESISSAAKWLDTLIWTPYSTAYAQAKMWMAVRREQVEGGREKPVVGCTAWQVVDKRIR